MIVESYEDIIILSGAIRSNQWETLHTAISLTLKRHEEGVVIDCSQITEMTPHGADTFRSVMDFLKEHDARVLVAAVPDHIMQVLKSVPDVRSQLAVVGTVEEARASLDLLRDPHEDDGHAPKKKKLSTAKGGKILACVMGTDCDSYLLTTARELATGLDANVDVVFPLLIPRDMPLSGAMPEEEKLARAALDRAYANLKADQIDAELILERGRDVASTIHGVLEEYPASHVVIGLPGGDQATDDSTKLVRSVLGKINTAVIFVRGPLQ